MKAVALIPARAGSKRVPGKNLRPLLGHPLLAYSISVALESGVFSEVVVSSEDRRTLDVANYYGAKAIERPANLATDLSPDMGWVTHALAAVGEHVEVFSILRPTSPFRSAQSVRDAYALLTSAGQTATSVRAVQVAQEHPGKMWTWPGPGYPMVPVLGGHLEDGTPWHSSPTQALPTVFVQTSSLEMAWTYVVDTQHSIAGKKIVPFFSPGFEGLSIDDPGDFAMAEDLLSQGMATLPVLPQRPYNLNPIITLA